VPYLELSVRCRESEQPRYERALEDVGALAVTLLDADAQTPNERAILEPGVGEMPIWGEVALTALLSALEAFDADLDWLQAGFRKVEDQDWERAWMDLYVPLRFGARTWIVPWNQALPEGADAPEAAVVRLDPGLAFGSGTHPTTALCLEWLDTLATEGALRGATVLDFGCGSGILALAALKLGAAQAVGIDNDPQAILATAENARRNTVDTRLSVFLPQDEPATAYPVVVANILAIALDALAETLATRVAPGGRIALSGILAGQEMELLARYAPWFDHLRVARSEDWVRIDGVRSARALHQGHGTH
jgi:ribosomal protein L11 methyltransferase